MTLTEAVILVQKGDDLGFEIIYDSLKNKKLGLIRKYIMDDELAIDVLQESFVTAWKKIKTLENPEKFESWFSQICVRTAINALEQKRHKALDMKVSFPESDEDVDDFELYDLKTSAWENTPELAYSETEIKELAHELINSLSDEQRLVVLMKDIEGMTTKEIAEIIGCPEATIKSRYRAGIKKLTEKADALKKKGYTIFVLPITLLLVVLDKENEIYASELSTKAMLDNCKVSIAKEIGVKGIRKRAFFASATGKVTMAVAGTVLVGGIAVAVFFLHENMGQKNSNLVGVESEVKGDVEDLQTNDAGVEDTKYLLITETYHEFGETNITSYEYDEDGHCIKEVTKKQSGEIYENDYTWKENQLVSSEVFFNEEMIIHRDYLYDSATGYLLQRKDYNAEGIMTQMYEYLPEESKVTGDQVLKSNYHEYSRSSYDTDGELFSIDLMDVNGVPYHSEMISEGETIVTLECSLDENRRVTSGCNYARGNDGWAQNITFYYEYDELGRLIRKESTSSDDYKLISEYTYDDKGNRILCKESDSAGNSQEIRYEYNADGNITLETYVNSAGEIYDTYETKYDENGNKIYYCGHQTGENNHIEIEWEYISK